MLGEEKSPLHLPRFALSSQLNPLHILPIHLPPQDLGPHTLHCDSVFQVLGDRPIDVEPPLPLHAGQHVHGVWEIYFTVVTYLQGDLWAEKLGGGGGRGQRELQTDIRVWDEWTNLVLRGFKGSDVKEAMDKRYQL